MPHSDYHKAAYRKSYQEISGNIFYDAYAIEIHSYLEIHFFGRKFRSLFFSSEEFTVTSFL